MNSRARGEESGVHGGATGKKDDDAIERNGTDGRDKERKIKSEAASHPSETE